MSLEGKVAIVTGGGTGVGAATAARIARAGGRVLINYSKSKEEANATALQITSAGGDCRAVQADVADDRACRQLVEAALDYFGSVDILVNNAATTSFIPHHNLDDVTPEVWQRIFAVNVQGPFQLIRAAREPLARAGGHVVNIASTAGITGIGSSVPYCASKAALINMTLSLARALAPAIRVNAVAPGFITGRWLQAGLGPDYDRIKASLEKKLPLGRVCDPDDIALAVTSLLEGSPLVTGQTLICDSGLTLGPSFL